MRMAHTGFHARQYCYCENVSVLSAVGLIMCIHD